MTLLGSASPLVSLLQRLRHAADDNEWLKVHEILCARMRDMSDEDIRQHVIRFYSSIEQTDSVVVERDIAALQSEIFRENQFSGRQNEFQSNERAQGPILASLLQKWAVSMS